MPTLDFKGKQFVHSHHLSVPFRELIVDAKKSLPQIGKKPSLDDNLIIHGDNLEALKALLPTHAGKVDCIFIDPPYNTGNEGWCYNDNVRSPLMKEWIKKAANPVDKEDLERHDKWLCMMWPRLQLLKELLAETGVIFLTIGDDEVGRLLILMDELFNIDRRIGLFTWVKKKKGSNLKKDTRRITDYVVAYRNSDRPVVLYGKKAYCEKAVPLLNRSNNEGELLFKKGSLKAGSDLQDGNYEPGRYGPGGDLDIQLLDPITVISGTVQSECRLRGRFRWGQNLTDEELSQGSDFFLSGKFRINVYRADQDSKTKAPPTLLNSEEGIGTNEDGTNELNQIFSDTSQIRFDYPKPTSLVEYLVRSVTFNNPNALILDSFAGSGTTAHAVLAANAKDGGTRRFILIEMEDYADTLTSERVRRAALGYRFTGAERTELLSEPITWTQFKKAAALLEKVESIEQLEGAAYDNVKKEIKDGVLTVTGEKNIKENTPGLGGSFTYGELGDPIQIESLLTGEGLPNFESLARYVFYTATGQSLEKVSKARPDGFIGETDLFRLHLFYQPEKEWLRSNDAALDTAKVKSIGEGQKGKRAIVFAVAKFMSQKELTKQRIDFCQLPYAVHRILGD